MRCAPGCFFPVVVHVIHVEMGILESDRRDVGGCWVGNAIGIFSFFFEKKKYVNIVIFLADQKCENCRECS